MRLPVFLRVPFVLWIKIPQITWQHPQLHGPIFLTTGAHENLLLTEQGGEPGWKRGGTRDSRPCPWLQVPTRLRYSFTCTRTPKPVFLYASYMDYTEYRNCP